MHVINLTIYNYINYILIIYVIIYTINCIKCPLDNYKIFNLCMIETTLNTIEKRMILIKIQEYIEKWIFYVKNMKCNIKYFIKKVI